ncbi:GNAT family N-acetyltransferase [Shewanella inventionis]|uniref:N-acetyltransferase n=1 Tax=Shewanella inventionis TaxID=1738770 RepID=A0ABQ1IRF2_9GAMM|nr:GNAT family N-acetyltransferase [Shewanella inventionis]MCL1156656.1 GNAT family N-acetyltransferase [Shewanella inventionis]UAL44871.1 GNAT family N-acetyltransferase [Shewanella inventionis]GGB50678.1 N-acetyltransferase [Shewanella inventionis]
MENSHILHCRIVDFSPRFASEVSQLYHSAVQHIDHPRYPQAKLNAWSEAPRSTKFWQLKYQRNKAWLALNHQNKVIGFISIETQFKHQGYIDCLYVAPTHQHRGIAQALFQQLVQWAQQQDYPQLTVDASYLSKGLFEKNGFTLNHVSYQLKRGQTFTGFYMQKQLTDLAN